MGRGTDVGLNEFVKLRYTSGHAPRVPSADPSSPHYALSYKLITGCGLPRQREMAQGAVLRGWRWRFVYLILC